MQQQQHLHQQQQHQPPMTTQQLGRVILHLDLDCFYAQVEQLRLGIPRDAPCAVQQWQGLIAVNYAARAAGVTRHMRVHEALKICPGLRLVHVQTIGGADGGCDGGGAAGAAGGEGGAGGSGGDAGGDGAAAAAAAATKGTAKACLQRYRRASAQIFRLLHDLMPDCPVEKASIDEAYIDATAAAAAELRRLEASGDAGGGDDDGDGDDDGAGGSSALARALGASRVEGAPADLSAACDRLLAAGAAVAARVRAGVLERLGYTCSAGVAGERGRASAPLFSDRFGTDAAACSNLRIPRAVAPTSHHFKHPHQATTQHNFNQSINVHTQPTSCSRRSARRATSPTSRRSCCRAASRA